MIGVTTTITLVLMTRLACLPFLACGTGFLSMNGFVSLSMMSLTFLLGTSMCYFTVPFLFLLRPVM